VLSALGVPWKTIREDYLISNKRREDEIARRLGQLRQQATKSRGIPSEQVDMTNINAFYILEPSYIDASLDEAVKRYGSMENYIREGLEVEEELIERLRSELLR
jgi:protein-tyrosine phosphatase